MRRFLLRTAAYVLVHGGLIALLIAGYEPKTGGYLAAAVDKHRRAASIVPPRVFVVGGSNVAFGLRSDMLERIVQVPVVNLGGEALQGLRFRLREVDAHARDGDAIVLSMEYQVLFGLAEGLALWRSIEARPGASGLLGWREARLMLDGSHLYLRFIAVRSMGAFVTGKWNTGVPPYSRDSFNRFGDVVAHHDDEPKGLHRDMSVIRLLDSFERMSAELDGSVELLSRYARQWRLRGVRPMYSYPPMPRSLYPKIAEQVAWFAETLRTGASPLELLDHPEDVVYDDRLFFDTVYHLTGEGAARRTEQLGRRFCATALPHKGCGAREAPR